jgi:biotin operon repressor
MKTNKLNGHAILGTADNQYASSLPDLARKLRISRNSARNLRKDGLFRHPQGYFVPQAEELLRRRTLRVAHLRHAGDDAMQAKARKLIADASMAELELKRRQGELLPRGEVLREWARVVGVVRQAFLSLPRDLAPRLAHSGPVEIQALLTARIFEILRGLARCDDRMHPEWSQPNNPKEAAHEDARN